MSNYQYTIILHPDQEQGGYTVTGPTLPGCITEGKTLEEAIEMAKEAIHLYIESLIADGEPIRKNANIHRLLLLVLLLRMGYHLYALR